jgi:hypothetical protein
MFIPTAQLKEHFINSVAYPLTITLMQLRPPSIWVAYKWYILALIAAVIVETLLIAWLLFLHVRDRQAEVSSSSFAS